MDPTQSDFAHLLAIDALLLKAAGLGSEAVFQNMERRSYQFIMSAWQERAHRAIIAARANWMFGMSAKETSAAVAKAFQGWEQKAKPAIAATTRDAYGEGKRQILLRAHGLLGPIGKSADWQPLVKAPKDPSIEVGFTLRDEQAIDQLVEGQLHWIGEYYDEGLSDSIDEIISEAMLQTGLGREETGKLLEERLGARLAVAGVTIPEGWAKGPTAYFELIAANTTSNGRVRGSLGQMAQIGVTKFTIVAVGDEKMCSRCAYLDGRTRDVQHVVAIMDAINDAETPEEVKQLHPWANTLAEMEAAPDSFPFPPFHGTCRCAVDIAEDSEITFEPLPGW